MIQLLDNKNGELHKMGMEKLKFKWNEQDRFQRILLVNKQSKAILIGFLRQILLKMQEVLYLASKMVRNEGNVERSLMILQRLQEVMFILEESFQKKQIQPEAIPKAILHKQEVLRYLTARIIQQMGMQGLLLK